jgi:hypothetical protein
MCSEQRHIHTITNNICQQPTHDGVQLTVYINKSAELHDRWLAGRKRNDQ